MKKIFNILFLALIFSYFTIYAKISEIKTISELTKYTKDKNTLVVLDIDNTILEPDNKTGIGSEQWFSSLVKEKIDKGFNTISAIEMILPKYYKVHETLNVKPVESNTIKTIKEMQQQKTPIIALTSRSFPMIKSTLRQLKDINLDLTATAPSNKIITFKKCEFPAKFNKGILFVGNNNKGKILKTYLSTISLDPTKIIMVDDKKQHLEKIESTFKNTKISFIGLRYTFLDNKVKNFVLNNDSNTTNLFKTTKNYISNWISKAISLIKSP